MLHVHKTLPAISGGPWALCVAVHQQATETTALGVATTDNLTSFPCGSTQSIRFLPWAHSQEMTSQNREMHGAFPENLATMTD